jgi:hypothetical protein
MPGLKRIGVEYDPQAASIAAAKSGATALSSVKAMPFPTGKCDFVVSAAAHKRVD